MSEKLFYFKGSLFSLTHLWDYVENDNLNESSISFQIPIYIIHGKYDYQVSHKLAKEYFENLEVPKKAFYKFENSAHSPNMEEPEKFVRIVREIPSEN